ncbi:hypothetical protein [Puniceicoccus vermicola]|uniref:Cell division protein FtsL n=1 Tax=Puniceicoccus vermicola TaxID=388746 RepID=A0A7X1E692_9BACT|nr:hypothetical protein [Puniceicoccus vermicola]MBC2603994.1 hypothetical protein [Puniceicoccus vermicola]
MKTSPRSFLPPLNLLLLGVFLAVSLLGGLSQVWIQRQISRTASLIEEHEKTLQDLERKNRYMSSRLAEAHRPDELIRRAGAGLKRPDWHQIVQVERSFDADGNRVVRLVPYGEPMEVAFND